jgi:hypothetical protein
MRFPLLALALVACTPLHENTYELRYSTQPRAMLWPAIEAARELHYSIAAIESPDVFHNSFLAFSDTSLASAPNALLVQLARTDPKKHRPDGFAGPAATVVEVTPMAFQGGHPVPATSVSEQTREDADRLMLAIYDATKSDREMLH